MNPDPQLWLLQLLVLSANLRSALVLMRIRTQLFASMRIWIYEANPMWIHADPDLDPDPGQTLPSQKILVVSNMS